MVGSVNVLSLVSMPNRAQDEIRAIDRSIRLVLAPGWFDVELRETWPEQTARAFLPDPSQDRGTRAERDALLAEANVVVAGFPVPVDLRSRAPQLCWFHQTPAGASNLRGCDLWQSDVIVTTSRGVGNTGAMAEYVVAAFLHFARGLHRAAVDREAGVFDRASYRPIELAGKTVCVVGVGGIGREVGRRCADLGMQVVGTRRSETGALPEGFSEVRPPGELLDLLGQAEFLAVCCQWTPETEGLIGRETLAALPHGAVVVNVARGEIIDEAALLDALAADRLRGVALDVYVGEFVEPPSPALWSDPRVVITPHVSAGSDNSWTRPIELFTQNLRAFVANRPMRNVIDWSRGY